LDKFPSKNNMHNKFISLPTFVCIMGNNTYIPIEGILKP
jgi:hypothetical protein